MGSRAFFECFILFGFFMTIGELLRVGEQGIAHRSAARLEAEVLLAWILDISKEQLFCSYEQGLTEDTVLKFQEYVSDLADGRPLAYIIGEREFYGLPFYVDERVLIPRPETEWLVEKAIGLAGEREKNRTDFSIVDVGTGSGAIGLSIAHTLPEASVILVDISSEALEVAKKNCERLGLASRVDIFESDLLGTVLDRSFDIVVANLPYIGQEKNRFIAADVEKYEPHVALFGGHDGLQLYTKLFQQIGEMKVAPKYLLGEFGFAQSAALQELLDTFFVQKGGTARIFQDLAGIDRYFIVSLEGLPL